MPAGGTIIDIPSYQIGVGTCSIGERAKQYVRQVLDSNRLTYGPFCQAFEKAFAAAHDSKHAIVLNSGTSALRIAIAALKEKHGWQDGDEVMIPAITFIADVNVIIHNNLRPVFVDVNPAEYNIDVTKIEARITSRTRAIMPSHLFGLSADMAPLMEIARKHDLRVIEDACESSFARYQGKPVGSFGDIGCFSTYQAHILTTGVGGFTLTNDPDTAVLLRSLANHGRDGIYMQIDDDNGKEGQELQQVIQRRFSFIRPGYSFRITEMEAALGLAEMEDGVENMIQKRQDNAAALIAALTPYQDVLQLPTWPETSHHVFMMFPIVVKAGSGIDRDDLIHYLETHHIETRMMLPILNQPFILKQFGDLSKDYPVAHHINQSGFYIGCHPSITTTDIAYMAQVIGQYLAGKK